jgi:flagellar basal-body rod protein FlgG
MERGLYIAASGMLAEQVRQDQIANDLANASTPGYKPDRAAQGAFNEMLLHNSSNGASIGSLALDTGVVELRTDLGQGPLSQTGNPLDLALSGDGFFAVETPQGVRYTRDGQFTTDAKGELTTVTGFTVLGTDGKPIAVGDPSAVSVAPDGSVTSGGTNAGRIAVVALTGAVKQGDTLFSGTPGARPQGTQVEQGYIEGSGVEPARAMVDMIVSLRAYEASQRVLHAIDDTLGEATSRVGSANS